MAKNKFNIKENKDVIVPILVILIVLMMILPIPTGVLDFQ